MTAVGARGNNADRLGMLNLWNKHVLFLLNYICARFETL